MNKDKVDILEIAQIAHEEQNQNKQEMIAADLLGRHKAYVPYFSQALKILLGVDLPLNPDEISIRKLEGDSWVLVYPLNDEAFFQIIVTTDNYGNNLNSQVIVDSLHHVGVWFRVGIYTPELHNLDPDEYFDTLTSVPITWGHKIIPALEEIKAERALRLERVIAKRAKAEKPDLNDTDRLPYQMVDPSEMNLYQSLGYVYLAVLPGYADVEQGHYPAKVLMEFNPALASSLTKRTEDY